MTVAEQEFESFTRFARQQLSERGDVSLEVLVELYRLKDRSDRGRDEDIAAVRAALRDFEEGEVGMPFDQFVREFRELNGIPCES